MSYRWQNYNWHVGLRVRHRVTKILGVISVERGTLEESNCVGVKWDKFGYTDTIHVADLIPLVKKKRREWWINKAELKQGGLLGMPLNWDDWFENNNGPVIRTTRPADTTGWILVREVK